MWYLQILSHYDRAVNLTLDRIGYDVEEPYENEPIMEPAIRSKMHEPKEINNRAV